MDDNDNNNENRDKQPNPKIVSMVDHIKSKAVEDSKGPKQKLWTVTTKDGEKLTFEGFLSIHLGVVSIFKETNDIIFASDIEAVSYVIDRQALEP